MSDKALIAARRWSDNGLLDRAVAVAGLVGATPVRILPEPLLKKLDDGSTVQSIRILFDSAQEAAAAGELLLLGDDDEKLVLGHAPAPDGSVRLLVRATAEPTGVELAIPSLGDQRLKFILEPQREWTVHVVHHSHFDFGYTDPQAHVFAQQRSYLDSAVDLVRKTAQWPEASRFRWAVESLWAFSDWAKRRPQAQVDEFISHVKDGSIELTALPYNLHLDTCSTDELHELLRDARRIRDEYGVEFTSAMQTDVPGQALGLPDALNDIGVRYLAVAHNWAGRSQPHTTGGENLPRMFRWKTPAGNSVLVWMTDSPHGMSYMEGPMLGFTESYDRVEDLLPAYLTAMATRGYPYPPGVFGGHGEEVQGRDPYPWDIVHLRTQGKMGDNGPARLMAPQIVRQWNETWSSPQLRISTNEDFFRDAEERLNDELQTFEGDWGDWWVEGVGSAAVPMAMNREAQANVTDGQSLGTMANWLGGGVLPSVQAETRDVYEAISMFNEHTWGAGNSWNLSDNGMDSGETQWQWKVARAIEAQQRGEEFVEHASSYLGAAVPPAPGATVSYVVVNTFGQPRSSTARVFLKESLVPFGSSFQVLDGRTGEAVHYSVEDQQNVSHRESGRYIAFHVADAPSFGYVRFDVVASDDALAAPMAKSVADTPRTEFLTIENEYLRVVVDETRSCIGSIIELETGRELVNRDSVAGFNGYIYDTYGSAGGNNHLANSLSVTESLELLTSRTLARPSFVIENVDDGAEQRLVYEYAAKGIDSARVTLRLRRGEPRLVIENRLSKPKTLTKESAFIAFPFAAYEAVVRFEVSGGVTGNGIEHVPGAPQHMRAIRNWATLEDGENSVAWVSRDAALVHPEVISLPYAPFPASTGPREPGTIFSWLHNNVWDTNFPIEQGFVATFSYSVGVRARGDAQSTEGLAIGTAVELTNPLRAIRATGTAGPGAASRSLLGIDDDRVRIVAVTEPDESDRSAIVVRLQSFAPEAVTARLRIDVPFSAAAAVTYLNDRPAVLTHSDGVVEVPLQPYAVTAVRLTIA